MVDMELASTTLTSPIEVRYATHGFAIKDDGKYEKNISILPTGEFASHIHFANKVEDTNLTDFQDGTTAIQIEVTELNVTHTITIPETNSVFNSAINIEKGDIISGRTSIKAQDERSSYITTYVSQINKTSKENMIETKRKIISATMERIKRRYNADIQKEDTHIDKEELSMDSNQIKTAAAYYNKNIVTSISDEIAELTSKLSSIK